MARPIKQGLDYFPLDTGFLQDIKVRRIMRGQGVRAISVLIALLSSIYRDEGYYLVWDFDDMPFIIAEEVGVEEAFVTETVHKAAQVGFFDQDIFEKRCILTSKGIQERYFKAVERRKEISVDESLLLIDVSTFNNLVNVNNNLVNEDTSTQSKVKESKEEKSRGQKSSDNGHTIINEFLASIAISTGAYFDECDLTAEQLNHLYRMSVQDINRFNDRLKESKFLKGTKSLDFYLANWDKIMSGKYVDYEYRR